MLLPTLCGLAHPGDVGLVSLRFVPGRGPTYSGGRPFARATVLSKFDPKGCVLPSFGGPLASSHRYGYGRLTILSVSPNPGFPLPRELYIVEALSVDIYAL